MTHSMHPREREAFDQANEGIRLGAAGDHLHAVKHWEKASRIADEHLQGTDINFWIKSGYGAALFDVDTVLSSEVNTALGHALLRPVATG